MKIVFTCFAMILMHNVFLSKRVFIHNHKDRKKIRLFLVNAEPYCGPSLQWTTTQIKRMKCDTYNSMDESQIHYTKF